MSNGIEVEIPLHENATDAWKSFVKNTTGSETFVTTVDPSKFPQGPTDDDLYNEAVAAYEENLADWEKARTAEAVDQINKVQAEEQRSLNPAGFRQNIYQSVFGQGVAPEGSPLRDDNSWVNYVTRYNEASFREGNRVNELIGRSMQKKTKPSKTFRPPKTCKSMSGLKT